MSAISNKAKWLYSKFYKPIMSSKEGINITEVNERRSAAKQCALIAVDLLLDYGQLWNIYDRGVFPKPEPEEKHIEYWQQVKKEIKKL